MKVRSEEEYIKREEAEKRFNMVKLVPYEEKWGDKWQQKSAKFRREFKETVQSYIQTSAWNKLELGKK